MVHRRKLSYARYEEIKHEVIFMFEETETDTFPIDCFKIARKLHYVLRPYSELGYRAYTEALMESNEGFSRVEKDPSTGMLRYVIYFNDIEHGIGNIRWTIFHEIGHIYLGHHDNPPGSESLEEAEANFFAKYAMCPPPLVNEADCSSPDDVLMKFNTSVEFSGYAYNYYQNWLTKGASEYLGYEIEMLKRFHLIVA